MSRIGNLERGRAGQSLEILDGGGLEIGREGNLENAYLAILVHALVERAADSVLSLEEHDFNGLIAEEMVGSKKILEGGQARGAGTDDGELLARHGDGCWQS